MIEPTTAALASSAKNTALAVLSEGGKTFIQKVTGGALEEAGGHFADNMRLRRVKNQIDIINEASRYAEEKGISPKAISWKTVCPLMDYAGNEEDPSMKSRWVRLLLNASDPKACAADRPDFVQALNEITAKEAKLLDNLYEVAIGVNKLSNKLLGDRGLDFDGFKRHVDISKEEYELACDNLTRLRLTSNPIGAFSDLATGSHSIGGGTSTFADKLCLTVYGKYFVEACTK